jgi:hypothetical protein
MRNEEFRLITEDMERLREEVLSRVRVVRRVRAFLASPAASAVVTISILLCASIFVSFGDIIRNIMLHTEWSGRFSYTYSSLMHARMAVQVFAGLTSVSLLVLCVRLLLRIRTLRFFRS